MTAEQKAYLQALYDVRSWQRWQIAQSFGEVRAIQAHEQAIAWIDQLIVTNKQHAADDEAERRRAQAEYPKRAEKD